MKKIVLLLLFLSITINCIAAELITNGNFSAPTPTTGGIPNWVTSTALGAAASSAPQLNVVTGNPVGSGAPCVTLGNPSLSYAGESWMWQNIYVPPDALGNTLTLYYQGMQQTVASPDWIEAKIGGNVFFHQDLPTAGTPTPTLGWKQITPYIPLGNYQGQTITVDFVAHNDPSDSVINCFYVDDVSLLCTIATKTPTPTITPTMTISPTLTITPTVTITPTITQTYTQTPTFTPSLTMTPWMVAAGDVIAFPNPATGSVVNFMYSPTAVSNVKINIYNLAGLRVARLEDSNKGTTGSQITTWKIQNVAPGVYLYSLTMESAGGSSLTTKMKKLVITR
jgi:hypothetical protein